MTAYFAGAAWTYFVVFGAGLLLGMQLELWARAWDRLLRLLSAINAKAKRLEKEKDTACSA